MLTLLTAPNYSQQLSIMFVVCGDSGGALLTTTHMLTLPSQAAKFQHGVDDFAASEGKILVDPAPTRPRPRQLTNPNHTQSLNMVLEECGESGGA